jgi:EmrB/QacA subfamily drug resistance transporter
MIAVRTLSRRETILAMAGLALVVFLVSLDQTVVGTAMPRIMAELNGFALYAWVTTAYLLAETAVIPIVGKLGDLFGRKWITIAGVAAFAAASLLCGVATNMPLLVVFRGLQGLGAGTLLATVFTLIADIFPDIKDRARYQGLIFAMFSLSGMIGPVLGGWITDGLGWRWVFYINLPLCVLALAVLPIVLPQSARQPEARIDYLGAITSTVAVIALLLSLELISTGNAWTSPVVFAGFAVAVIAFAAFVPIERRAADPIIPFSLFRNRALTASTLVQFVLGVMMMGSGLFVPLFVQSVLGQSAGASGTVMLPMAIILAVMGITIGPLIARFGRLKPLLLVGTALMAVGILLLTTLHSGSSTFQVSGFLVVMALGFGLVMPVTTFAVQAAVDRGVLGIATSATTFIRQIGATVGTALIGTLVANSYVSHLSASAPTGVPEQAITTLHSPNALTSPDALHNLSQLMASVPNGVQLTQTVLDVARAALASAIQHGFFVVLGASILAVVFSFFMPSLHLDSAETAEQASRSDTSLLPTA